MNFQGSNILSVSQLGKSDLETLFDVADRMRPYAERQKLTRVLEGAILGNMFFEPSTRTRVSFGCAFNLLGGSVRETTGIENSALAKGESLYDTAKVLSGYSDIIVMRHPQIGSVDVFANASRVPVLNAGDGANEHPSQALLDLYTINRELSRNKRDLNGSRVAMVGDLKHGRTVHSLSKLLSLYDELDITFVAPEQLQMPDEIIDIFENRGHRYKICNKLSEGLSKADVVYQTRIQEERFESLEEANLYRGAYRINQSTYSQFCQPTTVIMHPLPRDSRCEANELDNDLNENPNLAIFRQTENGVLVRMALFALVLGVENEVDKHSCPVRWQTTKR